MKELHEAFRFVGQINYTLSRLTFIVSQHLYDIGLEDEVGSFFANPKTEEKFKNLPSRIGCLKIPEDFIEQLNNLIDELNDINKKRNTLTHALMLSSLDKPDEFRLYNYRFVKGSLNREPNDYSLEQIENLNQKFINLHNEFVILLEKIQNCLPLPKVRQVQRPMEEFKEVKDWLKEEYRLTGKGFYTNIEQIRTSFLREKAYLAYWESEIIGFATISIFDEVATIVFMEMKPDNRKNGFGKAFIQRLINIFKKAGCHAIVLKSIDEESTAFWEKLDFIDITKLPIRISGFTHYLPISCAKINALPNKQKVSIEIWDFNTSRYRSHGAVFKVNVINSGSVVILPVEGDWYLKVLVDENETHNILIKRLENSYPKFLFGDFIVITDVSKLLSYIEKIT